MKAKAKIYVISVEIKAKSYQDAFDILENVLNSGIEEPRILRWVGTGEKK